MGMDVVGKNPSTPEGEYFRANVWSWRPIHALCEIVTQTLYPEWSYNDGKGLTSQEECDRLAARLENYLNKNPGEKFELESPIRVGPGGRLLPKGTPVTIGRSAYATDEEHVRSFIRFLRSCGGFEIW